MRLCDWVSWLIFGFVAGLMARALMPGEQRMGFFKTAFLGIGGSFVGGFLGAILMGQDPWVLHPSGFIGAVIGSIALLGLGTWFFRER